MGRDVYRKVLRLNLLDFRLLRAARAEVRRRFAMVPSVAGMRRAPAAPSKPSRLPWALRREEERKRRRGLFDGDFYLEKYPDVRAAGLDPLRHYVEHGAAEERKPNRLFDPAYYLRQRPEARAVGVDPLVDFLEGGGAVANPHPLFDCGGDAQRLVDYVAAKHPARCDAESIVISDESLDSTAPQQRAFFEAVRADQLRAQ